MMQITSKILVTGIIIAALGCGGGGPSIAAPSNLSVDDFSPSHVSMSWTDNSDNEDGFRIYRSTDGSNFTEIGTQFFGSYNDDTVTEGVTYYYRVTAYNTEDESNSSNTVSAVPEDYWLTVVTPNGGESLTVGDTYNISWQTNMPGFDARVTLSLDGGGTLPAGEVLFFSYGGKPAPIQWKVGYKNTEDDPLKSPVWEQVVFSQETQCVIYIEDYWLDTLNDESDAVFTISP
jgi:hypothetical protein